MYVYNTKDINRENRKKKKEYSVWAGKQYSFKKERRFKSPSVASDA